MGNSSNKITIKSQSKTAFISKLFGTIAVLFCSIFCFIGCNPNIQHSSNASFDSQGNLRILAPNIAYNYTSKDEYGNDIYDDLSGTITWNFSYYAKDAVSPEADEQYLGIMFYTNSKALELLNNKNLSSEEKDELASYIYKGDLSNVKYVDGNWTDGAQTLYRLCTTNIEFPNYEVVVDGASLILESHIKPTENLIYYNEKTNTYEINTNAIYFTYLGENNTYIDESGNEQLGLSPEYIRVIYQEPNRYVSSAEANIPFGKYSVVFNPQLKGTSLSRTIKVKALAKSGSNRGDSPYSTTITYQATRLAFSVYSKNSADAINDVGYLTYNEDAYYFNRIKTTVTSNPDDAKIIYLEGYFPEGRIVKVSRMQLENTDYAFSNWTTNKEAQFSPVISGTLPVNISNFFNFVNSSNTAILASDNAGAFNVNSIYNDETYTLEYVNRTTSLTTINSSRLFYDKLNIDTPINSNAYADPEYLSSTINVVAQRNLSGYTFYANYSKVKNFTQSGTVFAGDEFFNGNTNHYLTGYFISIYEVLVDGEYVVQTNDVFTLKNSNHIVKTDRTYSIDYTTTDGRIIEINIIINGSSFEVTGLEHNMTLVFDKTSSSTSSGAGIETKYSFHNATMSSILLGESIVRSLFVAQSDRVLCGVIGTEYAESSNIEVIISQVDDDNNVGEISNDIKYEIIKSVTTKEDIHGYVTTNIILSIIVPENHILVSYNVDTPIISTQIQYKYCNCEGDEHTCIFDENNFIYYNATTNEYYKTEQTSNITSGITFDGTSNYILYNDNLYTYNYRNSSIKNGVISYHSYYYGNYVYADANKSQIISFDSIVVTTTNNITTYTLRTHTPISYYFSTTAYDNQAKNDKGELTKSEITFVYKQDEALSYLQSNLINVMEGILISNESDSLVYYSTLFHFKRNADGTISLDNIEKYIYDNSSNADISTNASAYASSLYYKGIDEGGQEFNQQIFFYYDIKSHTQSGTTNYYYTAPLGRELADGEIQWFYHFSLTDTLSNLHIVKGQEILQNKDRYITYYNMLGEKIVNHYYYYIEPVTKTSVQARQYNTTVEGEVGFEFYTDPDGNELYTGNYEIELDYSTDSIYKLITINNEQLRITFNPSYFTFKINNNKGEDVTTQYDISFSLVNIESIAGSGDISQYAGGMLYNENGEIVPLYIGKNEILPSDFDNFDINNNDFKNSGIYEIAENTTGSSITFEISYTAIKISNPSEKITNITYDGVWKIDGNEINDLTQYFIFPNFKINGEDAFIKISKSGTTDAKSSAVVTTESQTVIANYYYIDENNKEHQLYAIAKDGKVYKTIREAYTLNENNQKTQIMIWGKYIPTSDPNDPIIYPTFSIYLEQEDNAWIFDPRESYYYDIDYSSEKAIKEGFIGANWLAGSPYPNPVLYLSVRHKLNEFAQVNIAVDIKSAFFAEIMADKLENDSSNIVLDFSTYSFKDTLANIDANDYINNIYYVLERSTLSHITGYKIIEKDGFLSIQEGYENGLTLKVNEIVVADDGTLYWLDGIDANGVYTNKVYVKTDSITDVRIDNQYYRPLTENECFAWRTSKKYVKDVGYFDVHGYTVDGITGTIIFNSGELDIDDVCMGLNGLVLGTVNNIASDYNYDEVIIAGTTSAYRTSYEYAQYVASLDQSNNGFFGLTQQGAIPILDAYDTNDTYFLMGKECLMLIADPIINTESKVYYRFLEWRIYSRYNSGILYYDRAETEKLNYLQYSSTLLFSPQYAGHYVILPVYERVFEVSVATEVENGPQNQGGSVITYYKDGSAVDIENAELRNAYTVEYLKTLVGGRLGYYYKNLTFTPYVYFGENAFDKDGNLTPDENLLQVIEYNGNYYGVFKNANSAQPTIKKVELGDISNVRSQNDYKNKLFKLEFEGIKYFLVSTDENGRTTSVEITSGLAFGFTCQFSQTTIDTNNSAETLSLYQENNYLYIITNLEIDNSNTISITFDVSSPIAETNMSAINIVNILKGISSSENDYYHYPDNDLVAGENAYDENGNLLTRLNFKTSYIDRASSIMLTALPDEGYRLLGWYTKDGKSLEELYGEGVKTFSENDKIIRAYKSNGEYYYGEIDAETGEVTLTEKVHLSLLYRVRGLYINKGTEKAPSYVEVFYSSAKDAYYYDSTYTIRVEDKYTTAYVNGIATSIVKEMAHVNAITSVYDENTKENRYYLNELEVYEHLGEFYRAYSTGNIEVEGNNLIIKSLHSNIEFVAVFREVYQSMILTDSEDEFGISIEAVYYFNNESNSLANRINNNGEIIEVDDNAEEEYGFDKSAQNIDANLFKLFNLDDQNHVFYGSTISNLINSTDSEISDSKYNGYIALTKDYYKNKNNAWYNFVLGNGMTDATNNAGKQAMPNEEGETFALKNLYFDDNTTALIVVRTLSTNPLQLHTLGLPSEYNLQPIIYPSDEYITSNSTKPSLTEGVGNANDYKADYLYYVFELTFNRDPENEYADLLIHPTREISIALDILTGNYLDTYSQFYDIELSYTGINMENPSTTKTNTVLFNFASYFDFSKTINSESGTSKFNFFFKNQSAFVDQVIKPLLDGIISEDSASYNEIYNNITGLNNANYYRLVDFIDYINANVLKNTKQNLNITGVQLSNNYLNALSNALKTLTGTQLANLEDKVLELELAGLIEKDEQNNLKAISIKSSNDLYYVDLLFDSLGLLIVENERSTYFNPNNNHDDEYYDNFAYVNKYTHEPVGDGSVNIINLTAITMYNFSIQSLTIDGYDENGNIIYSDINAHELGDENGSFVFYTAVGTNNRTYMGGVSPTENFLGVYYNGALTNQSIGIKFTNQYIDNNPDYQKDKDLPNFVYKDFLLAKDSLLLIEGLKEQETKPGYQFMGWYQQKRITSIYDRYYDLNGNKLTIVNENTKYALNVQDGKNIIVYNDTTEDHKKGDIVEAPTKDIMSNWLYYIDTKTLELYRQDGTKIDVENYEYREWASMELVSTTYKYPYVAVANADTIITALFKRAVDFNYSFNPLELSVTSSTSIDSLGNPLKYTVTMFDGNNSTILGANLTNKQDAYNLVQQNYIANYTYEITVSGSYYIDATPTLTISPVGGFRLNSVIDYESKELLNEFDEYNNTIVSFSNNNSLKNTNIETTLIDGVAQSTFDKTNLAGNIYATFVINNLYETSNLEDNLKHIAFTANRVIMTYTQIEGFCDGTDNNSYVAKDYDFVLSQTATIETDENGNKTPNVSKVYFDTRLFRETTLNDQGESVLGAFKLLSLLPNNYEGEAPVYAMSSGFLDEWVFNLMLKEKMEDEQYKDYTVEELTIMILASQEYKDFLGQFEKTSANAYIYIEIENNNLIFYGYFDNDFTDSNTLNVTTISNSEEKAIDHWYINAQTPSSISGATEGTDLNENVTFPTIQSISFESEDEEYNKKYVLSKDNLVYHLRATIEKQNVQTIAITLQNDVNETANSLVDLGTESETDNSFVNTINYTYTGVKYTSLSSDRFIDLTEGEDNDSANGTVSAKYHVARFGTGTTFVLSITDKFLVIENSNSYPNGELIAQDVYAFVGWVIDGEIVSADLSFTTTINGTGKIEARFAKIAEITFVNGDDNSLINMQALEIEDQVNLTNKASVKSTVFGYYPDGNYYYALIGHELKTKVYPDDGYVLESVLYTNPEFISGTSEEEFLTAQIEYATDRYPYFVIAFQDDAIVKINIRQGFTLTVNQIQFNDFNQTTKGTLYNSALLYNIYKLENGEYVDKRGFTVFAQGSKIKLTFNANNLPFSLIGWYVNDKLITSATDKNSCEFELTENTVVELRIVKNIYINIKASDTYLQSGTNLNVNVILDSLTSGENLYNGNTPLNNNSVFVLAGEKLEVSIADSIDRTFLGWYYLTNNEENAKLLSTEYSYIFSINADNPYIVDNTITLVAVFAYTKEITIEKTLQHEVQDEQGNLNFDVYVTYTNGYGNEVKTNLGKNSSITINAKTSTNISLEAFIEKDNQELYFFEGFWVNGTIRSYQENYEIQASNLSSGTIIKANFLEGNLITITRRLNDDPYTGDAISLTANYNPSSLSGKTLEGDEEYIEIGFREPTNSSGTISNLVVSYNIKDEVKNNYTFIGWFINNKPITDSNFSAFCQTENNTLTITDPYHNLVNINNTKISHIEARFAELANITLKRSIDGAESLDLSKYIVSAHYNTLSQNNVTTANVSLLQDNINSKTITGAYKYTSIALTASRYAGYEFVGFKVTGKTSNGETIYSQFITDNNDNNLTADVIYYYLGNYQEIVNGETITTRISEYEIEAYYSKQYTINVIGTVMGTEGTININAPKTISAYNSALNSTEITATTNDNLIFVGYYDLTGNKIGDTTTILINNANLISLALNNQIFIEARYAKQIFITIKGYNSLGIQISSSTQTLAYGVTTTITGPAGFSAWALPNPDESDRLVAYYNTKSVMTILPLEDKTYYALCGSSVGSFSHSINPIAVTTTASNGIIPDGSNYTTLGEVGQAFINVKYKEGSDNQWPETFSINYDSAIEAGYLFIGWVAGAKYLAENGYHYLPYSNELTIKADDNSFNDMFAVFAPISTHNISLDSGSHANSFNFTSTLSFSQSSVRPFMIKNDNNIISIITFQNSSLVLNVSAIDGYTLASPNNSQTINTQRVVKHIILKGYQNGNEQRVAVVADNNISTSNDNTELDTIILNVTTSIPEVRISVNQSENGTVTIINQKDEAINTVNGADDVLNNLLISSKPNDNYYLSHFEITRTMDLTRTQTYIVHLKHFSFKVLDGAISITAVFRKSFDVVIDNTVENVTDKGNTTTEDITETDADQVTKQVTVVANENYRISGIIINNEFITLNYNANIDSINASLPTTPSKYYIDSVTLSDPDQAETPQQYIKALKLNITSEEDVNIAFVYNKVVNIELVNTNPEAISENDGKTPTYNIYYDDSIITFNGYNADNNSYEFTKVDDYLTPEDIKNKKDVEGDPNGNPKFLAYYYNNEALKDFGIDITGDTRYTIIATYAKYHEIEVSIGLYDRTGTKKLNPLGTYSSIFNTPLTEFRIDVTKLTTDTSGHTDVSTTILLNDPLQTATVSFYDNNNLVLNAFSNNYFVFACWKNQNNQVISNNAAINPNSYENITKLEAVFYEETRTMIIVPDYEGDNISVGASNTNAQPLESILSDDNNINKTISLASGRNIVISQVTRNNKKYFAITYSVASSELGDTFFIADENFKSNGDYYTYNFNDNVYKFKNFTQQNGKILTGYNYTPSGNNLPNATVQLKDFYQNQDLNLNTVKLINIQYTYAILSAHLNDIENIVLKIIVNNETTYQITQQSANSTFSQALLNIWVEEGDIVTISASKTGPFNTIGYSKDWSLIKSDGNGNTLLNIDGDYNITTTLVTDLSLEDWQKFVNIGGFSNLVNLFNRQGNTDANLANISNYSFIANENMYFIADYIPIFEYDRKFINAVVSVTDKANNLTNDFISSSFGNSFVITPSTPDSNVQFEFKSNTSTILNLLDKNNNLISVSNRNESVGALTWYEKIENEDYDEYYDINSKQTNDIFDTTNHDFGENGIHAIIEQLANVSVKVGYSNAATNSTGESTYILNHYNTLFDDYLAKFTSELAKLASSSIPNIGNQGGLGNIIGSIIGNNIAIQNLSNQLNWVNDVQVLLDYYNSDDNSGNSNINTVSNYVHNIDEINYNKVIESYVQAYLKVGSVVNIKTKVLTGANNYFFKGFLIVNSASTNNINLFADGKQLTHTSSYNSYKVISRENLTQDENGYYTLENVMLSGDTQIIALYEKALLQVEVRLKNNNDQVQNEYNELLKENATNLENLAGQTINGIDLDNDPNSSSGKLASTTTTIVPYNSPAIVTTINYPFGNLIGFATDNTSTNLFAIESGVATRAYSTLLELSFEDTFEEYVKFANNQLLLVNPNYARNNLYIEHVTSNIVVGAYFAPMSYVISIEINETELAADVQEDNTINQVGYVSVIDENGNAEFIETFYDENGLEFGNGQKYKIKSNLISIEQSLIPTPKVNYTPSGEEVPVLDENGNQVYAYYLRYVTGERVFNANNDDAPIEIIPKQVKTGELDENNNAIYEYIELNSSNFYKESNISLYNYQSPSTLSNYFNKRYDSAGSNAVYIKSGLISIIYNNKQAIDLATQNISAVPIDKDGNIVELDNYGNPVNPEQMIVNYRINLIISAKANVGFPSIKIKMGSPTDDTTIIPYTFDDTDYLNKLLNFVSDEESGSLEDLSIYDRNNNHDLNVVSGFYNRMFENTEMLTNPEYSIDDCNFTLKLIYARTSTPLVAQIQDEEGKTVTLTSRAPERSQVQDIEFVKKNVVVYKYYIVENGASIANKMLELLKDNNTMLLENITYFLDILHNFPRYQTLKNLNSLNGINLFDVNNITINDLLDEASAATGYQLGETELNALFNALKSRNLIDDSFDYTKSFTIKEIDVLAWFTGEKMTKSVLDYIDEDIGTDQELVTATVNVDNQWTKYYNQTSENFNEFYIKSGDSLTTYVELSLKYQHQMAQSYNNDGSVKTADKGKLYYNEARLDYKSAENLGRLMLNYNNNIQNVLEQVTIEDNPTTWQQISNFFSALFNCKEHFEGTYIQEIISSCYPTSEGLQSTERIVTVLTTNDNNRLAVMELPFWLGWAPSYNENIGNVVGWVVVGVTAVVTAIIAWPVGVTGLAIAKAVVATAATVAVVGGITYLTLGQIISQKLTAVNWSNLPW